MKINFKLMAMTAAALLAMNSCTQEEDVTTGTEQKGTPVTFQMGVNAISRTVTEDNSFATTFTEGDEVGIFAYNGSTPVATNARYRYNGSAWEAQGEAIYAEEGISYSYYAYYPYSETATDITAISLSVATDQTAGYTGSDALIARNEDVTAGTTTVTLQYSHAFALVQVSLSGDEAAQDATVTLQNVYPTAIINLQSGEVGDATGTQGTVAMKTASTNTATAPYSYRAIVPAQTITANTAILTTTSNGTTYRFSYSADVPYEEGKLRQINVTLGTPSGSEITIEGADDVINDWEASEDVSGEGSVEEVVEPLQNLITTPFSEITSETYSNVTGDANLATTSWFSITASAAAGTTYTVVDDDTYGKVIQITYDGTASWYNNTTGFYNVNSENVIGIDPTKTYRLSFSAKTDVTPTTNNTAFWCFLKLKTENCFCAKAGVTTETIGELNQTCYNLQLTNDWAEYQADFTFSIAGGVGGIGSNTSGNADNYKEWADYASYDYYIGLSPRNTAGTYYVTNIRLEEVRE